MFDPPILINCRDRVAPLRELVDWLERAGHQRIILLDNRSTYAPLLEYYERTPHTVRILQHNYGARALWLTHQNELNGWYIYTDPDVLPIEECPLDLVGQLRELMAEFPRVPKAGPSLYLEDLPEGFDPEVLAWERTMTSARLYSKGEVPAYLSKIDTTFALYRPHMPFGYAAIRTGRPYLMRHSSWYTEGQPLSDEDAYYLGHATKGILGSSWGRRVA
jgi:hypothetical protein